MALKDTTQLLTSLAEYGTIADIEYALLSHTAPCYTPLEGTAGADYDHYLWRAPKACTVTGVWLVPNGTLTAHDTNYKTVSVGKEDGAAGGFTDIVTPVTTKITGGTGNWAIGVVETLTVVPASAHLDAGQVLAMTTDFTAAGVATPPCAVVIEYQFD